MAKMKSDMVLDYAVFQLSPKRSRCELFVSSDGSTEKLASGLLKPFVSHLQIAEQQVASASRSIKLEVGRQKNAETWFTKGTLERFVRFVSTPEVLEIVNTLDAEILQLEAARKIYSQGAGDHLSGGDGSGVAAGDDATKKELLRAIDVRLVAVRQDLSAACARAAAAGFNANSVSELQMFADKFGADRLNEACAKVISLNERRPELTQLWRSRLDDGAVRSSYGSDMSIENDPPSPPPRQQPTTCQLLDPPAVTFPKCPTFSREPSVERDAANKPGNTAPGNDTKDDISMPDQAGSIQVGQPLRRLSVQDRINMFENKQKESSGGKPAAVKPVEMRRLSSDISSSGAAAAVLRRWSGASDMSIDLSSDKKDAESPVASHDRKVPNLDNESPEISSLAKPEMKFIPSMDRGNDNRLKVTSNNSEQSFDCNKSNSSLGSGEVLKDHILGAMQSRSSVSRTEDQESSEDSTLAAGKIELLFESGNQGKMKDPLSGKETQITGVKNQVAYPTQIRPSVNKGGELDETANQGIVSESRDVSVKEIRVKANQKTVIELGVLESGPGSRILKAFASRYIGIEGDSSSSQKEFRSVGKTEVARKTEFRVPEKVSSTSLSIIEAIATGKTEVAGKKESDVSENEDSGLPRLKFNRKGFTAELSKRAQAQQDKISSTGNSRAQFSGQVEAKEGIDSFSTPPPEQAQRRQAKGNQELNNELKMKASELEKLFAEQMLRIPGDQSSSARKGKLGDTQCEALSSLPYAKPVAEFAPQFSKNHQSSVPIRFSTKLNDSSPVKTVDQNDGDAIDMKFSDLSVSEGSRGKFYDRYMQKRDVKLREDWSQNREAKEASLKYLQDSLERNRSDMMAKISGSGNKQDSASSSHRRAERLRSYNSRSIMKREQQRLDFGDSEDDEEALDFPEQNRLNENKASEDVLSRAGVSRGAQGKKHLTNNKSLSSTPLTFVPVPRSATKSSTTSSGRQKMLPDNPLAHSVPNFSNMRKENTKPSSGANRTTLSQVRSYIRSKSTTDEAAVVREYKSRRSQSLRKSSANPSELREMSPVDSDGVALTPTNFDEEILENAATKPSLKKGSRTSFVAQKTNAKEDSGISEPINNQEVNCGMEFGPDEFVSTDKDGDEQEFESLHSEGQKILNNGEPEPEPGVEPDKFINSGSENGDDTLTFSLVDQALGSKLPIPSSIHPVESIPDWSGESPLSWKSHTQHPFSYPHEISDVDASVDSLVGSPASWNSHSSNQIGPDAAARMRKKWGMAQKPMLAIHSSNNHSRKDMTSGFKRLLKFGRRSRGSENLVDWISATTSEGDDDTEDGRDPAYRSSEDLRKSRMGCHSQASEDSFNEREFFSESVQSSQNSIPAPPANFKMREDHMSGSSIKAPRSFFSLSSFRSKGGDSHPR